MGLCKSKKMVRIHNNAFDLVDADGDHKVDSKEINLIADFIHEYHVKQSAIAHNILAKTAPVDYIYQLLDKSKNSKLKRKDFNVLTAGIPPTLWNTKILPALRQREISRLENTLTKRSN